MLDYISREALQNRVDKIIKTNHLRPDYVWFTPNGVKALAREFPAADVVEVRHGRWIIGDKYTDYRTERCSACGFVANRSYIQDVWFYCPWCGAKMNGGQEDGSA